MVKENQRVLREIRSRAVMDSMVTIVHSIARIQDSYHVSRY